MKRPIRLVTVAGAAAAFLTLSAMAEPPVQLVALPTPVLDVVARSTDMGHSNPDAVLHLAVGLPYADPAGMQAFVDSVSDPASPSYRQFLTPEQIGARFGLADNQVQAVVDYLKAAGFTVNLVGKNHLSILADGTVAQAEAAFHTTIHEFQTLGNEAGNSQYFSHTSALTVPAAIAPSIIDVSGLESFTKPELRVLNPTQTRSLYNLAPMYSGGTQGQGRVVAVSNWTGFRTSNIPLYYSQYGLPAPSGGVGSNVTVITYGGGSGAGTENAEGDLDQQMVLGMAPLCTLRVYDGAGSGSAPLIGVLTAEVNDNLSDIITESYGWSLTSSALTSAHNLHLSMSAQGITYMAASGDNGTNLSFPYPDIDPEVLMVGGTVATVNGSGGRSSEAGWSGSGGGWSTNTAAFNVLPSWQHGTGVPTGNNHRLVPDVALNASGSSGAFYFYYQGNLTTGYAGTSFASPVFAGSLAVAEQQIITQGGLPPDAAGKRRFGRIQNLFYSQNGRSDVWFDITSGSNGNLPSGGTSSAGAGWDYVTGWGAINFNAFVTSVLCTPAGIGSNPTNVAVCAGSPATFSVSGSGTAPFTYQWHRGAVTLQDGGNISGSHTATLTINPAGPGDANADYYCTLTNSCGSSPSSGASLTVNSADFNNDGDIGTDADIEAFFACLGGSCCPTCGSADFNADGDVGTDADIEAFFRVLAGGAC